MDNLSYLSQTQSLMSQNIADQKTKALLNKAQNQENTFEKVLSETNKLHDPEYRDMMQRKKIKETAQEFEAQFLGQMLKPMFENINVEEPFSGGHAEKMWQSLLVNEYGKSIAARGGIGLADDIERQLLQTMEGR